MKLQNARQSQLKRGTWTKHKPTLPSETASPSIRVEVTSDFQVTIPLQFPEIAFALCFTMLIKLCKVLLTYFPDICNNELLVVLVLHYFKLAAHTFFYPPTKWNLQRKEFFKGVLNGWAIGKFLDPRIGTTTVANIIWIQNVLK